MARLAAVVCQAPLASLVIPDSDLNCWCSGSRMLPDDQIPRRDPFFPYVARERGLFTISNAAHDLRFSHDELVTGPWALRCYAGVALRTASGKLIGALAVYDTVSRELSPSQAESLSLVAQQAAAWIELGTRLAPAQQAWSELRRSQALCHNTIEEAPIGIAYTDRAGRFLRCNRAFGSLLGFTPEELENRSIISLTHSEDVVLTNTGLERLWRREVPFVDFEKRFCRKDGSALWVRVTKSLVAQTEGAPECLVEFVRDISVRKRLSTELEAHQALLETLLANLPLALIACDADGKVTHYNREAAEMCSMPRDDSASETSTEYPVAAGIYHADGVTPVDRVDRPLARTLRGETVHNLELVIVPRGSAPRVTLSNGRRLVGPNGQTMGALVVTQDITERRRGELELERVHDQLRSSARQAGMAEVATSVLHNVGNVLTSINVSAALVADKLRRSKAGDLCRVAELLQTQGEKLGEFMSTDERGQRVPGYLQALGELLVKDTQLALEHVASLQENLEHVKNAVAMQQNYAKLTSLRETVNVVDLVEDSLRLSAGAFTRHGITLRREFGTAPAITVDKHKVLQILVNLVRNAKYACDESGKKDKVLTLRIDSDSQVVRIAVIDNGVGIAPENMSRLFTHGFTTRRSGHGFGLHSGAIAAHELGGSLHAESAGPGQGATFTLELPRDAGERP